MEDSLIITCPSCKIPGRDEWDVFGENEIHEITCQFCKKKFFVFVFECEKCAADNVMTSLSEQAFSVRVCHECGHRGESGGGDDETFDL